MNKKYMAIPAVIIGNIITYALGQFMKQNGIFADNWTAAFILQLIVLVGSMLGTYSIILMFLKKR